MRGVRRVAEVPVPWGVADDPGGSERLGKTVRDMKEWGEADREIVVTC